MTAELPTFSVVSMMREEDFVVERFVRYYLELGASQIIIFYDGELTSDLIALGGHRVEMIECTQQFWQSLCGKRPSSLEAAQFSCFAAAHGKCTSDWFLVVDADEFVFGDLPFREFLSLVPDELVVRIPVAEAVWGPGEDLSKPFGSTYFRLALPRHISRVLDLLTYGWTSLEMRRGLHGHDAGKQVLRTRGQYSQIGNHMAFVNGKRVGRWARQIDRALDGVYLGHFDAISFERWRDKCMRRTQVETLWTPTRRLKLMHRVSAMGERDARRLFSRLYGLNRWQLMVLNAMGAVKRRSIF